MGLILLLSMRGQTLDNLLKQLKVHIGDSLLPNSANDAQYAQMLTSMQQEFATQYRWDFMDARWDVQMLAGVRYYTFPSVTSTLDEQTPTPAKINFNHPPKTSVFWTNLWLNVTKGIGPDDYNFLNSSQGQTMDPVQKWRFAQNVDDPNNPNTFEVWPTPASSTGVFRFWGQRVPTPLDITNKGTSVADLDDQLLTLWVAANQLALRKQGNAGIVLKMAQARLLAIRAGSGVESECYMGGKPESAVKTIRTAPLVVVHG